MSRAFPTLCVAAAVSLLVGVTAALAGTVRGSGDPGVTADSILLGGTAPLAPGAPGAAVARGADAYFRYVNANGGVNGRKITYRVVDDTVNPSQAVRDLVEQDKVFAMFNTVGAATSALVRPYLASVKVPQLFVASGATTFGRDAAQFPGTTGFPPSYQAEGWVYGKYLARTAPGSTVAVLFQNDDIGKDLLAGLRRGLERSRARVVAAQPYEAAAADVAAQVGRLKVSGADTLVLFATTPATVQAYQAAGRLGWKPKRVVTSSAGSDAPSMQAAAVGQQRLVNGTISIAYVKDPTDPTRAKDSGLKLYRRIMAQYAPLADVDDPQNVYGMAAAWTAVEAIRRAGKDLTRASLLKTLDAFNAVGNPFLVPGIALKTSSRDHFPIEQMVLQRWQKGAWHSFGGLWAYRPA